MIEVQRLSKRYGSVKAIERISFEVGRGEIVGLLGPNGAGKTTTMRILTTYLAPTSGIAVLAGHDILDEPLEVRRKRGLPAGERAALQRDAGEGIPEVPGQAQGRSRSRRRLAISQVISRCRLSDVENRILGHLSRGFRQRGRTGRGHGPRSRHPDPGRADLRP